MPSGNSLPEDLKTLAFRNALRVDSDADFHHHINRLCSSLQSMPGSSTPTVGRISPSLCNAKTAQPSQNAWSQAASESTLIVSNLSGHSGNFQIGM